MEFKIKTGDPAKQKTSCLVLGVFERRKLAGAAESVDKACGGRLAEVLKKGDLDGDLGRTLLLYDLPGVAAARVLLVGCGKRKDFTRTSYRQAIAAVTDLLQRSHSREALITLAGLAPEGADLYLAVRDAVTTTEDRAYRYSRTKDDKQAPKTPLKQINLWIEAKQDLAVAEKAAAHGAAMAAGVRLAKELGNLPGNICTPSYLADQARELASRFAPLKVQVLEESDMEKLGMGALLSVSRGSREPAKLIVFNYRGRKDDAKPVVLVGKGLTFDAGGDIHQARGRDGRDEVRHVRRSQCLRYRRGGLPATATDQPDRRRTGVREPARRRREQTRRRG